MGWGWWARTRRTWPRITQAYWSNTPELRASGGIGQNDDVARDPKFVWEDGVDARSIAANSAAGIVDLAGDFWQRALISQQEWERVARNLSVAIEEYRNLLKAHGLEIDEPESSEKTEPEAELVEAP